MTVPVVDPACVFGALIHSRLDELLLSTAFL